MLPIPCLCPFPYDMGADEPVGVGKKTVDGVGSQRACALAVGVYVLDGSVAAPSAL